MAILQKGSWGRQNQQTTHVKQKKAAATFQNELHMGPISLTKPHYLLMQTSKMSTFFTLMNVHLPLKVLSSLHNTFNSDILLPSIKGSNVLLFNEKGLIFNLI